VLAVDRMGPVGQIRDLAIGVVQLDVALFLEDRPEPQLAEGAVVDFRHRRPSSRQDSHFERLRGPERAVVRHADRGGADQ
jgi:hypothetical protein